MRGELLLTDMKLPIGSPLGFESPSGIVGLMAIAAITKNIE